MGNGEETGFFARLWNLAKKVVCTIVCAWFEILVAVVVFIFAIACVAITFFAFFIGVAGESLLVVLSGGRGSDSDRGSDCTDNNIHYCVRRIFHNCGSDHGMGHEEGSQMLE